MIRLHLKDATALSIISNALNIHIHILDDYVKHAAHGCLLVCDITFSQSELNEFTNTVYQFISDRHEYSLFGVCLSLACTLRFKSKRFQMFRVRRTKPPPSFVVPSSLLGGSSEDLSFDCILLT